MTISNQIIKMELRLPEPLPEPPPKPPVLTAFQETYNSFINNLKEKKWFDAFKDLIKLPSASIAPSDIEVVGEPVFIGLPGNPGTLIVAQKAGVFSKIFSITKATLKALKADFIKRPLFSAIESRANILILK